MTAEVINLAEWRKNKKENPKNFIDEFMDGEYIDVERLLAILLKKSTVQPGIVVMNMPEITRDYIDDTIALLTEYGYDPQERETADNMILLSMLFQAHIDHLDGNHNNMYDFFGDMKLMVFGDEEGDECDE